jgi:excisionase family DNA binding protein
MAKQFLRMRDVAARYGNVSIRTVERMIEDGRLPKPHYRGRFPLFDEEELDASDRALMAAARSKRPGPKRGGSVAA